MPSPLVTVEPVERRKAMVRFTELAQVLHGSNPCFAPPVMAWERYRLDPHRNPYFERGDATYLLARRAGRPAGRVAVHVPGDDAAGARFGFWATDGDPAVAEALLDAARAWAEERGHTSLEGPWSFTEGDEPGLLVAGHDVPGTTGRPWHPPWEAEVLAGLGLEPLQDHPTWRLRTDDPRWRAPGDGPATPPGADHEPLPAPGHAGAYGDTRLVLPGVAAVPDLAPALRSASLRGAWALARRARLGHWERCTVVAVAGDAATRVPALVQAAGAAGYEEVVAPWHPAPAPPPEARHRTFRCRW